MTCICNVFHMKNPCLIKYFYGSTWGRKLKFEQDTHPIYFDSYQDCDSNFEFLLILLLLLGGSIGYSLQQSSVVSLQSLSDKTLAVFHFTRARGKGRRDVEEILLQRWSGDSWDERVFLLSSTMQVTIIYSFKMPLFCEYMPRKLNDGQNNSVAQVKLAVFHMRGICKHP